MRPGRTSRNVEPQPDWWFVGGRARPGDTTHGAAARNLKRELGLTIDPARFEVLAHYSFVWRFRQQAPQANGTADISTVHTLRLTAEEAETVKLDEREYMLGFPLCGLVQSVVPHFAAAKVTGMLLELDVCEVGSRAPTTS